MSRQTSVLLDSDLILTIGRRAAKLTCKGDAPSLLFSRSNVVRALISLGLQAENEALSAELLKTVRRNGRAKCEAPKPEPRNHTPKPLSSEKT